ncbi:MAG: M28 family peptidase [Salibacteraceae bacterium]|nr:M28 family peptidase [Salibacteraceae bacterium]
MHFLRQATTVLFSAFSLLSIAQTNIQFTSSDAADILAGNYNPNDYISASAISDPHLIAANLTTSIQADSLKSYLFKLSSFETRHTASDTLSTTRGIGAARRWAYQKFQQFSAQNGNRLEVSYLQFDQAICAVNQHRNIVAVLPGADATAGSVIIEGHIDSRCDGPCDTACLAEGMEDNGSGSALVLELSRVMSKFQFDRTIVFMLTIGEEQGLYGATAMATYCTQNNIQVAAVLNNDVIGGVICGETSSSPSCPGLNDIDSTQVRLFSAGGFSSMHKQLARYIKLQYQEELIQHVTVPQMVTVMSSEDRSGRGGDHIPFRQQGFPAMRFTSANEHGDASNGTDYHDRQHTSNDILGIDTDNNGQIDSFFVDFNYLARNAAINANAATMIAQNVCAQLDFTIEQINWHQVRVVIDDAVCGSGPYRVAFRSETNDWDTLVTVSALDNTIEIIPGFTYFVSVARQNEQGIESLFSGEKYIDIVGVNETRKTTGIELLQNRPNPFDESTLIAFMVYEMPQMPLATISISDLSGKVIKTMNTEVNLGINEIIYDHGYGQTGTFIYSLNIDGNILASKKMVFRAN